MIKGRVLLVVGMMAVLGVSAVRAEETTATTEPGEDRLGFYVAAQGLYAFENFQVSPLEGKNALGFKGRVGYRFLPMLAAEGEIEWAKFDLDIPAGVGAVTGGGLKVAELQAHTFTLNLRAYAPPEVMLLDGRLEPFLVGGVGFMNADVSGQGVSDSATRFAGRGGAGIEFHVTDHVSVIGDAEYVASTNELQDFGYLSVGWGVLINF
jgi:opacity protein-like surface antigen